MRFLFILLTFYSLASYSQNHRQPGSSEIKLKIKKLNFLGSVLYVAAHPDDENTRAISYFISGQLAATANLSMTRGDGGQNLIGPEIRDQLGLIRTQELLSARRIDGGQQFFTRANDFGFSKNSKETFEIWNKDEILSDVTRVYRQFQPDVVITRFPPDERAGHGHHTASAMLAIEAFDKSIDPSGKSYSEIAAESRTQHKSQGFGSPGRRGDAPEYLELAKGEKAEKNIFEGVNTTWSRIKGAENIPLLVDQAVKEFKDEDPVASVPMLLKIRSAIHTLSPSVWKARKENEVNHLIQDCLGLFAEVTANVFWSPPGEKINASFEIINRSNLGLSLTEIKAERLSFDSVVTYDLKKNVALAFKSEKKLKNLTRKDCLRLMTLL